MKLTLIVAIASMLLGGCSPLPGPQPPPDVQATVAASVASTVTAIAAKPTPVAKRATVTDPSVPFAGSESDALVPRGLLGNADLGHLAIGCTVEIIKTTDRAAQVKVVSCPPNIPNLAPTGMSGWVAKSALSLTSP